MASHDNIEAGGARGRGAVAPAEAIAGVAAHVAIFQPSPVVAREQYLRQKGMHRPRRRCVVRASPPACGTSKPPVCSRARPRCAVVCFFCRHLRCFTACASILAGTHPARRAQAPPWMQMATDWRWKPRPPHNLKKTSSFSQSPLSRHSVATQ